jgi:hypothetical protein
MNGQLRFFARALVVLMSLAGISQAQTGWGVDGNGNLFSFDTTLPGSIPITSHGNLGFVPEGIDFRPGTSTLYAIEVGATTTQLYTVNTANGAPTPVGPGFPSSDAGYNLTGNQRFGFDFNPSTLMLDDSMRIRLVSTGGVNMRLNSSTGLIASNDTTLVIPPSSAPFVDAVAYLNNQPNMGTIATVLFDMDSRNQATFTQNPPNAGTLVPLGDFGATITDVQAGIGFDIYTTPGDVDPTIVGDTGFAVLKRSGTANGAYLLYQVSLGTGGISGGKLVGPDGSPSDFTGGFAVQPGVPEPATLTLLAMFGAAAFAARRR